MKRSIPSVLVVCSANICRSPVVEAVMRDRFVAQGIEVQVESAGTLGLVGERAAEHSASLMSERGLDLSAHRSRAVEVELFEAAALVVCMAQHHVEFLLKHRPDAASKVTRLADLAGEARDVPDPYGGPRSGYEIMVADVTQLIERAWPEILRVIE